MTQVFPVILLCMKSLKFLALCLGLGLSMVVSGCGGSGSSGSGGGGNNPPTPAISSISPKSVPVGSGSVTVTVSGSGFVSSSVVQVGGTAEATSYVSATQLTAAVPAAQLMSATELAVVVANGSVTSGSGTPFNLEVDNPAPTIASVSPTSEMVGATAPQLTVTGTGFVATTTIDVNGTARATTFGSGTQVTVSLTAADLATAGTISLTAINPTPGGGTSAAQSLTVNDPPVGAIQLSPATLSEGGTSPVTITVTGSTMVPASVVQVNATPRATTYVSPTMVTFAATVADQATAGTLTVTVTNPAPGGGTSSAAGLTVNEPPSTPVITSITPDSIVAGSSDTTLSLVGTGFTPGTQVEWNGAPLAASITFFSENALSVIVPAADLGKVGSATIAVNTPTAAPSLSNAVMVNITNASVPTLTALYPGGGPINVAATVSLSGTGFTALSTVAINGQTIPSTFQDSTQMVCTIPASAVALPGNANVTVTTPAPGGGTSTPFAFTVFLPISNNDIVYNAVDGLLYASIPVVGAGSGGNTIAGIDPATGSVIRQIQVGSNPNKLALSTDGTQLFVGVDGAAAVAQVDLTKGAVVNQFSLGGGPGIYNPPYTASYLAAVPGLPNSVAVASQGSFLGGTGVTIYDSGVARANSSSGVGEGPLSFGSSASTLYMAGSGIEQLTIDSTGVSATTTLASPNYQINSIQYDSGRIYLSNGQVLNASTGALLGTFYSTASNAVNGPAVSDSTLGRAFFGTTSVSSAGQVLAFDESSFNAIGNIPVNDVGTQGYPTNFQKIVRWGQNGLALSAQFSAFAQTNQIFVFQLPLVKDLSDAPADLSVSLTAPATATTGQATSWVAKVNNKGPELAEGATLAINLDPSLIINSVTTSQGTCGSGAEFTCDLGNLANGASATITVSATPTTSGTFAGGAIISSTSYDPITINNQANSSMAVTGNLYGAMPSVSAISPNFVQAGSASFTLTVNGTGFNSDSTVNLGTIAVATTYVSATQITAAVPASEIANYGWAAVTVTNPSPGGGVSQVTPLTIYDVVPVPASGLLLDPYSQMLYATVPSTATGLTGNSVVTINPVTGAIGSPVAVGSEPTVMAESADGNYLYIGLSGSASLAQFDPVHQKLLQTLSLSSASSNAGANPVAYWLSVMPGTDTTLAVGFSGADGILDINGNTGTFRTNFAGDSFPQFGDASHLYTYDNLSTGADFYRYSIDANGATLIDGTTLDGIGGFGGSFTLADGLVYGAGGGIINPSTTPPSQIATLPSFDFYAEGINGDGVGNAPDPSLQKEFLMMVNTAGTWAYGLARYDLNTYVPEALIDMPASASSVEAGWTMLRFGQDGLALLSSASFETPQPVSVVMLLRGPFVTPQLLATNTAATLTSSSAGSITHGSGNTILTITGSNFLPGVAVTWNGHYRTTTRVSSTQVTVAIPASDLASTSTVSLVATNPGAPASNLLQITIN